ncbi:MAG: patatin-like phospholipase family protein [Anaerolineae bacterium]
MTNKLAFVLAGGGARGALQVGALRALYEHGYRPDLMVGTSAGAVNAAFVAIHGFTPQGLDELERAWISAVDADLLPSNYVRLTLRGMLRPTTLNPAQRIREFFVSNGVTPGLCFGDIGTPDLIVVSSDLNAGRPVLHGLTAEENVLDALLVSTALPPWVMPKKTDTQYLMDGAMVSSLPVEPAMLAGATDIVALDLLDARDPLGLANTFGELVNKLTFTIERRETELELEIARARGVPVTYLDLTTDDLIPIWDFGHTRELIERGYDLTLKALGQREQRTAQLAA